MGKEKVKLAEPRDSSLFNSPLETGIRSLIVMAEHPERSFDLQRLVFCDYLLVHSGDVEGGPESLHPAVPHRSGEILVRRENVAAGLALMVSRELVKKAFTNEGILYKATELAKPFLQYFSSDYFKELRTRASWINVRFASTSDKEFSSYVNQNIDKWGTEFFRESHSGEKK